MWVLNKSENRVSSRRQIQIKEVKDDILILPDNEYRLLIEASSINFELKSEEEQDVLIDSFQNFLNSLSFPLQILVRVREIDIDNYLDQIAKSKMAEKEKVYKTQIDNYSEFIKDLVLGSKILSRRFYITVPYKNLDKNKDFKLIKEQMHLQRGIILKGLEKLGMKAKALDSLELLDLFYSFYNPSQIKTEPLRGDTIKTLLQNNYV
jgi:hypothetical protein